MRVSAKSRNSQDVDYSTQMWKFPPFCYVSFICDSKIKGCTAQDLQAGNSNYNNDQGRISLLFAAIIN